ncbi:MAG: SPOR domain-containing protein [Bacteroidales bacterium]|nr:SPOR domain-containing protein [Bacteroidales bacterium]
MNITRLIVEVLQSGKNVEIKGIGTFSSQMVDAHHDKEKGIFYPERRSAVFSNEVVGDDSVIDILAQKECVNRDIAEKMWQTYISALHDKLEKQGSHLFSGLGTIIRCADGFAFTADPALDLDGGQSRPIEDVKFYGNASKENPFDTYEQSMQFMPEEEPAAPQESNTDSESEIITLHPADESSTIDDASDLISESSMDNNTTKPDPSGIAHKDDTESDVFNTNSEITSSEPVDEPSVAEDIKAAEDDVDEPDQDTNQDSSTPNIIQDTDRTMDDKNNSADVRATIDTLDQIPDSGNSVTEVEETHPKKKHTLLWIVLSILLLLIAGGCYLYFSDNAWDNLKKGIASIRGGGSEIAQPDDDDTDASVMGDEENTLSLMQKNQESIDLDSEVSTFDEETSENEMQEESLEEDMDRHQEEIVVEYADNMQEESNGDDFSSNQNDMSAESSVSKFYIQDYALPFTFSTNLIAYDQKDISRGCRIVRNNLNEYVSRFLASRRYTNAKTPMMERIGSYAEKRFGELYDPNTFYVDRLLAQKDYIHEYLYDFLKQRRESQTCVTIQSELMSYTFLDGMLNEMVAELGLQPDAIREKEPAIIKVQPQQEVLTAQFVKESKKGYDIIAGFYTNKSTANRMANILKRQGCDAYIIDKQGLYYVSMGSTPTQTAAEALFKHIKSWYDGDIAIRKL